MTKAVSFFVPDGLGDRNEVLRRDILNAAVVTIDLHGKDTVGEPVFEDFLDQAPDNSSYDSVRQSVVILMGSLARHLDKDDPKVLPIIGKLVSALATPSQQVQEVVANCLPPLVPSIKDEAPKLVTELLHMLLTTENYGERKGAAYGLAWLVKGLGILSLKQLDIMTRLTEAIQNKKNHKYREGVLYIVLPSLLAALEEEQWRTKTGSIELPGARAFCAPKQLSSCPPSIVPKLIDAPRQGSEAQEGHLGGF